MGRLEGMGHFLTGLLHLITVVNACILEIIMTKLILISSTMKPTYTRYSALIGTWSVGKVVLNGNCMMGHSDWRGHFHSGLLHRITVDLKILMMKLNYTRVYNIETILLGRQGHLVKYKNRGAKWVSERGSKLPSKRTNEAPRFLYYYMPERPL